jgi:hypothetical protein
MKFNLINFGGINYQKFKIILEFKDSVYYEQVMRLIELDFCKI